MRHNPHHAVDDVCVVRALLQANPWATLVSNGGDGLVASHCPVLIDDASAELAVLTHVGRPDERLHDFGSREVLLIVAGPHGYISPSWYSEYAVAAPTWNFSVAHCYGVPEMLDAEENLRALTLLVERFERHVETPMMLDQQLGARLAAGTVGLRLPIARFVCKVKMSQDKDPQSQQQVLAALEAPGPYANPVLAQEMRLALTGARTHPE
jgi:transcriptional regulator